MSKPLEPLAGVPKVNVLDENGNRILTGYYVYHTSRQLRACGDELKEDDVHHYVLCDGFADWGMPKDVNIFEVIPPDRIEVCDGLPDFLP